MGRAITLADRIRERLKATGKSASAVSLEAGLSRSAIRDILNGKAGSPRMDTLLKLAGPLGCTVAFLSGHSDDPAVTSVSEGQRNVLGVKTLPLRAVLRQGVYVEGLDEGSADGETTPVVLPDGITEAAHLYKLGDDSLAGIGLFKDDLIIAQDVPSPGLDALIPGAVVIVQRALAGLPEGPFEYSARIVSVKKGAVSLVTAPKMAPEKVLLIDRRSISDSDDLPRLGLHPVGEGTVQIEGIAVRSMRDFRNGQ